VLVVLVTQLVITLEVLFLNVFFEFLMGTVAK